MIPRRRYWWFFLGIAAVVAIGSVSGFRVAPEKSACLIGDARARNEAVVPAALASRYFDARTLSVGFGLAAIGDWHGLGDALVIGGRAYVRSTAPASPQYYRTVDNPFFLSNFLLGIPAGMAPTQRVSIGARQSLAAIFAKLAQDRPRGSIIAGYARAQDLATIALARAPIRALPVSTHAQHYYTEPLERRREVWIYLAALTPGAPAFWQRGARPHYARAYGDDASFAQALILHDAPRDLGAPPRPEEVVALGRPLARSIIERAEFAVFPLAGVRDCGDV